MHAFCPVNAAISEKIGGSDDTVNLALLAVPMLWWRLVDHDRPFSKSCLLLRKNCGYMISFGCFVAHCRACQRPVPPPARSYSHLPIAAATRPQRAEPSCWPVTSKQRVR